MKENLETKLLRILREFKGLPLTEARIVKKQFKGKELLTLELIFSDNGLWKTMVLALDKEITEGDYEDFYEELIK